MDKLRSGDWDWMVLHENLLYQVILLRADEETYRALEESYVEYAGKLAAEIAQAGTSTALLVPWEHPAEKIYGVETVPSSDDVVRIVRQAASAGDIRLAPVGPAWSRARESFSGYDLYDNPDDFTPSFKGTYLIAAALYATILDRSPVEVSYLPTDILPETGPGAYFREQWAMTEEEAAFLRQVAWDTVQEFKQAQ